MSRNTPRGVQFIRAAIATTGDVGELARLRDLAREQWDGDPLLEGLEALIGERQAEIEGRPGTQIALPLRDDGDTDEDVDGDAG